MSTLECEQSMKSVLTQYGEEVGLGTPISDEDNVFTLEVDTGHLINFLQHPHTEEIIMWMLIGSVPKDGRDHFLTRVLEANLFLSTTDDLSLSLMPDGESIVLARMTDLEQFTPEVTHQVIHDFLDFTHRFDRWVRDETDCLEAETVVEDIEESGLRV
ncbi:type III secretion system chaperone [Thalassoglobus sp. JC818]|uniref:type III secretion system chaperone n=1 Tax=Thalassoglobus sp. JC818 TaxID=3232136 RepID=UPI003457821C